MLSSSSNQPFTTRVGRIGFAPKCGGAAQTKDTTGRLPGRHRRAGLPQRRADVRGGAGGAGGGGGGGAAILLHETAADPAVLGGVHPHPAARRNGGRPSRQASRYRGGRDLMRPLARPGDAGSAVPPAIALQHSPGRPAPGTTGARRRCGSSLPTAGPGRPGPRPQGTSPHRRHSPAAASWPSA